MSWTHHRARVASLSRDRDPQDPELLDARRDLRVARLEEFIRDAVAAAPPFTAAQRASLSLLLSAPADEAGGDRDAAA